MLGELRISNFALIDEQVIPFGPGLNVLSGETGSGKSIVLGAIQFLLGEKPRSEVVRTGADQAEVQGLFDLSHIASAVIDELPDIARSEELVLARTMSSGGKSRVHVNGRLASVALLEEISSKLVNVCSQNHHVRLLNAKYHLDLLDGYAHNEDLLLRYRTEFDRWKSSEKELATLSAARQRREEELSLMEARAEELRTVVLAPGIRAELEAKVKRLGAAARILEATQRVEAALESDGEVAASLQKISADIAEVAKLDPAFSELAKGFTAARTELKEFERGVQSYAHRLEIDEQALETARDHLAEVARLERKYKLDDAGLVKLLADTTQRLSSLGDEDSLKRLEAQVKEAHAKAIVLAEELSKRRKKAAEKLGKEVAVGLKDLNMAGSSLGISNEQGELTASGHDRVELMLSSNRGEPQRPLREIASGGELSRILLVLKQVLSDRTGVNVLVFDEVDTGVSGGVARAVGQKLRALAQISQVICVTHLPQVASLADHHFLVDKQVKDRTRSVIRAIDSDERIEEIARMLAGYKITPAARESARELLTSKS